MAVINPIVAQRSIDTGGIPSTQIDDSVGRGLQQVGGAVSQHANRLLEMKRQDQAFAEQQRLNRWNDDNALEFAKLEEGIAVSGEGFADTSSSVFTKRSEEFLRDVPPELQPRMQELVATAREQWVNRGIAKQIDQRNTWFDTTLTERANKLQGQVFNDPNQFQASKDAIFREIDASDLPVTLKDAKRKQAEEMLALAVGEREIRNAEADPRSASGAASRLGVPSAAGSKEAYRNAIASIESKGSGGYSAIGPKHETMGRALGRYQIMEANVGPWSKAALGREVSVQEFMDPVMGPAIQDAVFDARFGSYVSKFGPEGAAQAWFAGEGGVGQTGRKDVLGTDVGTYGKKFLAAMGQSTGPEDSRFANLTLSQRLSLYDQMQEAAKRGQTVITAQNNAAYDAKNSALLLGIQENKITSAQQVYAAGLKDSETLAALKALETRQKDNVLTADAVAAFQNGTLKVDPYSSDDRKKVDAIGKMIDTVVPADQQQANIEKLVSQTGSVPESVVNRLRAGAVSQSPADVQQAMEIGSRLSQINRNALSTRDGGASVQNQIDLYDSLKRNGYDALEAARRVAEQNDPEKVAKRQAIVKSEPVQKVIKKVSASDVQQVFSSGWFSSPNVGGESTQQLLDIGASIESEAQIVADYKSILEDAFAEANGNETVARDLAKDRMKKIYGVSETSVFGPKTVMRLPPENTYAPLPDGSHGYIKEQLYEVLKAEGVDFDEAWLESYDVTDADYQAKRPAHYQIVYSKGAEKSLFHLPFYADRDAALAKYQQAEQLLRDERMTVREQNMAAERYKYPEGQNGPERFGNDELYRGIAREGSPLANAAAAAQQRQVTPGQVESANRGTAASMADYLAGGDIPMGAGSAWANPEAQQVGGVSGVLQQQRKQLFNDATNNGTLPKKGK